MLLPLLVAVLAGICLGIGTGLTPGIHINLIAALLVAFAGALFGLGIPPLALLIAIMAMAVTHTFLDVLPSVYLGAPDEAMALNALPAHKLLLKGEGHLAVLISLAGSFASLLATLLSFIPLVLLLFFLSPWQWVARYGVFLLIGWLFWLERFRPRAILIFSLSGMLGIILLQVTTQPFYHLFTGFFGVGMLLLSVSNLPEQKHDAPPFRFSLPLSVAAVLSGIITGILPGTTNSTSALLFPQEDPKDYLFYVSGINTSSMLVSLATLLALAKSRNGIVIALSQLLEGQGMALSWQLLLLFLSAGLIAGGIAVALGVGLSRGFSGLFKVIPYSKVKISIIAFLIVLSFVFDGPLGLFGLLTAAAISVLSQCYGLRRTLLLGCLLVPLASYAF